MSKAEEQRVANERLIAALKDLGVFSHQDESGHIFYGDDETFQMEVAVVLTEDSEGGANADGAWELGQYALGLLEGGDIEVLWWPEYPDAPVWGPASSPE